MRIKRGMLIIIASCMGTALAMAFSGHGSDTDTANGVIGAVDKDHTPSSRPDADQREAPPDTRFDLAAVKRSGSNKIRTSSLFQSKSWYTPPPPPPPAISLPPPPPTAPQLPFTYIGRMIDGKVVTLFLSRNDSHYVVKANDVLDDTYRVDKITDTEAVLTYIPMNTQQTLVFTSIPGENPSLSASASNLTMQPPLPSQPQQPNVLQLTR